MMKATHFIEVFTNKGNVLHGSIQEISKLNQCLKNTVNAADLKTVAVWKITPKK